MAVVIQGGGLLVEQLAELTKEDIESASEDSDKSVTDQMTFFIKSIATSCRALGHTPEVTKLAGSRSFAMLECLGLSSVYLTVSPSDECSFQVRLYTKPQEWMSGRDFIPKEEIQQHIF